MCKNLSRPLILGRDFLIQNHISVRYSENGKCILDYKQQEFVASICVETKPQLSLANSMTLPGRTLAVVHINNNLNPEQSGQLYEIEPNYLLTNEYPNLCIIPMIHNVDIHKTEDVPLVVINFLQQIVFIFLKERLWVSCKVNLWIYLRLQLRPLQSPLPFYWKRIMI